MLRASQVSLAEIAVACGFADQSHLSRVLPADVVTWLEPLPGEKIAIRVDGAETGQMFAMA